MSGAAAITDPTVATITANIFDGTRQSFSGGQILITVRDGNQGEVSRDFHNAASVVFRGLRVFQNSGDNYAVLASAKEYKDAGFFPVKVSAGVNRIVDLMLLPKSSAFNFAAATWPNLTAVKPKLGKLFSAGTATDAMAAQRYSDLEDYRAGAVLACLLNMTTAMDQIHLPLGTPLDYLKEVIFDRAGNNAIAQDRFFAWADPAIIPQIQQAKQSGVFADAPFNLHPGATSSYKQIQFGEANVQLTFHEQNRKMIGATNCVMIEPDIDYFRDPGAHLLLEVVVNAFGSLSDPAAVYALRWIAGRQAGVPEFDPLYTIEKA